MKVFVLEDNLNRIELFQSLFAYRGDEHSYATNFDDAVSMYLEADADVVFLDHDLGGRVYVDSEEPNTGYQFVKWIVENDPNLERKRFFIHSWNPIGSTKMLTYLIESGANAFALPFDIGRIRDWMIAL